MKRPADVEHAVRLNAGVVSRTQKRVVAGVDREAILKELHNGRTERDS